jgi:2-dehydrotetronate isomerase
MTAIRPACLQQDGAIIVLNFAANLSFMFNEWSFLDRFAAAADAGFTSVEYLFPYDHSADEITDLLDRHKLTQALFNIYPGDFAAGERGLAALPGRETELDAAVEQALFYAQMTGVKRLHLMAGIAKADDPNAMACYKAAVRRVAQALAAEQIDLVLEPINSRDIPGYFLNNVDAGAALITDLALPNLKLQFDIYHCQIIHGDVTTRLRKYMDIIGHVQIASVPSRGEPDIEELNYPFLFDELERLGYAGYVGCEYRPRGKTLDGLGWFKPYRGRGA